MTPAPDEAEEISKYDRASDESAYERRPKSKEDLCYLEVAGVSILKRLKIKGAFSCEK